MHIYNPDRTQILGAYSSINNADGGSYATDMINGEGLSCDDCSSPEIIPTQNMLYEVIVTNTEGCTAEAFINVLVTEEEEIHIPNVFSPNGDGINDNLKLFIHPSVAEVEAFRIFNRWGGLVFEAKNLSTTTKLCVLLKQWEFEEEAQQGLPPQKTLHPATAGGGVWVLEGRRNFEKISSPLKLSFLLTK